MKYNDRFEPIFGSLHAPTVAQLERLGQQHRNEARVNGI